MKLPTGFLAAEPPIERLTIDTASGPLVLLYRRPTFEQTYLDRWRQPYESSRFAADPGAGAASLEVSRMKAVIIGWEGIEEAGKPIPYSLDNLIAVYAAFPEIEEAVYRLLVQLFDRRPQPGESNPPSVSGSADNQQNTQRTSEPILNVDESLGSAKTSE